MCIRWIILSNNRLMNTESGKCLASMPTLRYAVMRVCSDSDLTQRWMWHSIITQESVEVRSSFLEHWQTKEFLRCGCDGS